jgi:hypothetical protein
MNWTKDKENTTKPDKWKECVFIKGPIAQYVVQRENSILPLNIKRHYRNLMKTS